MRWPEGPPHLAHRTWNIMPNESPRRMMTQPALKTQMHRQQFQPLSTVMEHQPSQDDAASSSPAADVSSPSDGYQSSTSLQRAADAARDAQYKDEELSDVDWLEYWRNTYDDTF